MLAGVWVVDEKIWISVPVLDRLTSTALSFAGSESCNINPTPRLKLGSRIDGIAIRK